MKKIKNRRLQRPGNELAGKPKMCEQQTSLIDYAQQPAMPVMSNKEL